ncbi:MAG: SAM-dependent methyltransferase [Blastochloris viridis]|uniref:SAM-dependent methyltransferase n=1 Tax=Blastochloris viridis TaxID=1079 RepID=A0A6N4R4J1_BLAVI|nr:MAG: SAM-dependent methyltransferase [Blastochloris viridis]
MKYNRTLAIWLTDLTDAIAANQFVRLALTKPTPAADDLKSVDARLITVKRELKLSFTYHYKTRDIVKNYTPDESKDVLAKLMEKSFTQARMFTLPSDNLLVKAGKDFTLTRHGATEKQVLDTSHDKPKQRLITTQDGAKAYLHALGITDAQGNVRKDAQDKFRQINKYVEILDGLVKSLPQDKPLKVADMGSGKGYLTFALYDHLTTNLKRNPTVIGVEFRPDMVKLCNEIAKQNTFTGLSFVQGGIADYDCTGTDVIIALHACDTATDDALAKGIKAGAQLIVVAPCCHKQIRKQMNQNLTGKKLENHSLGSALRFGTYAERTAEMVTDTLRALLLEKNGYETNVFEFIAGEHTPKNVMITATRTTAAPHTTARAAEQISSLKSQFGITAQHLENALS